MSIETTSFIEPDLFTVLLGLQQKIFRTIRAVLPGQVVDVNVSRGTVTVQPLIQRVLPTGTVSSFKPLSNVPIQYPQGGGCGFQSPIEAGDQGLILFCDRDISAWKQAGTELPPPSKRAHNLSDAFFMPGINCPALPLQTLSATEIRMFTPNLAARVGIDKSTNLITLQNQVTSLLTLLTNLSTVLTALTVEVSSSAYPLTAASMAAIVAWQASLAELLY